MVVFSDCEPPRKMNSFIKNGLILLFLAFVVVVAFVRYYYHYLFSYNPYKQTTPYDTSPADSGGKDFSLL